MKNILICNRGEIAYRAVKACKELDLRSFAIVSDNEKNGLVALECDKVIGFSDAINPFLNLEIIEQLINQYQIDAIYPGYGFLSEDSRLAKLCEDLGVTFIGPHSGALDALSSKRECMSFAKACQFDVLKIEEGDLKVNDFPVMLKASLGGGGRGNAIAYSTDDYNQALEDLKKRSLELFQNDDIITERYLPEARHIELQFFATDKKVSFLSTRDCSLQRKYQKFMEEGPGEDAFNAILAKKYPFIEKALLDLNYTGAGTIEFLWDRKDQRAYFLEVNTRIQVEHTVTEMIYDIDLVRAQFEFSLGNKINFSNDLKGHSICCRIYAVDSRYEFTPDPGFIHKLNQGKYMRFDTYIGESGMVPHQYDPMIGKLMVHGEDRKQAIQKTIKALSELNIHGVKTNKDFLLSVLKNEDYQLDLHHVSWSESIFEKNWKKSELEYQISEEEFVHAWNTLLTASESSQDLSSGKISHHGRDYYFSTSGNDLWLERCDDGAVQVSSIGASFWSEDFAKKDRPYSSPITGKVVEVLTEVGQEVQKGQKLVVLEAMKTLVEITALSDGVVKALNVVKDGLIDRGQVVLDIE
jgi:acetyl/propionyl-CoA carboxylase alpha subunit